MLSLTQKALEEFDNQHDFERMCADILNALGYKDVTPIAPRGGSDGGRDIVFTTEDGGKGLACVTLRKDSEVKFDEDFSQRKTNEYEKYYFFTNRYLTATQKLKFAKYCLEKLNAEFISQDREALRSLLDNALQSVRKRYLNIDDEDSSRLRKHITKILKYPATLSPTNFQERASFAEWRLTQPTHREIYYYINEIDDEDLQQIPIIGITLHRFKEYYYNFCLRLNSLTETCKEKISTQTESSFQFIHGWTILFDYFLIRGFGNSPEQAQKSVGVNYGITYEKCEQIFNILRNTPEIGSEVDAINGQWKEITEAIRKLTDEVNIANTLATQRIS
jgi:hypothetical protein